MLGRLTLLLALLPAIALAAAPLPVSDGGRPVIPPQPKVAPAPPAPAAPTPVLMSQPAAVPPDPAECRSSCAQTYYFCRAGDRPEDCGGYWSQCLAGCSTTELDPTAALAP